MKTKSLKSHLEKRLNKKEIAEIEAAAQMEYESLKLLQEDVSKAVAQYMKDKNVGFNELASKLGKSPSQVSKIIKGEANLTLASVAQIFAMMEQRPHLVVG